VDVDDTPAEAAVRAAARAWLTSVAKLRGQGEGDWRSFRAKTDDEDAAQLEMAKAWQRTKFDAGWAAIHWPAEHGGRGQTGIEAGVFAEEEARFDVSARFFVVGIDMAGPTLMAHGTREQQARFLEPMLRGDEVWCQLFSEPGAGSDLASLACRAERDGDRWIVTGQKVWTSLAHAASWGLLLARSDPTEPRHKGLTCFVLDMRAPGVEVRPLRQMTGDAEFNEVFLDGVVVPDAHRLGAEGNGWAVALTTLMNERSSIGGAFAAHGHRPLDALVEVYRRRHAGDPVARQRVADARIRAEVLRLTNLRAEQLAERGAPGPEGSVAKLGLALDNQHLTALTVDLLGPEGTLLPPSDGDVYADPRRAFLRARANTIEGGTSEVMRNILGERVLGLPREPR
jgi:alkylation response protein AidB-like acyl-CoA dehydrogenase